MRIDFYRKLTTFETFGGGWEKRVEEIRKQALLMVQR
jgi:lysozyme family protein